MNITQDEVIRIISGFTQLTPVDAGEFSQIDIQGMMKFNTSQYDINGLGNLSVMTSGMASMQMISFVVTPFEKNMPLMSADFIINGEGVIEQIFSGKQVNTKEHATQILSGMK